VGCGPVTRHLGGGKRTGYAYTDDFPRAHLRAARTADAEFASGPNKKPVGNLKEDPDRWKPTLTPVARNPLKDRGAAKVELLQRTDRNSPQL